MTYRPWKGLTLWAWCIIVDAVFFRAGHLTMAGFVFVVVWATYFPGYGDRS